MPTAPATPRTSAPTLRATLTRIVVAAIAVAAIAVAVDAPQSSPVEAGGISSSDWLGVVNVYRAQSGLAPVTENPAWSGGAQNHSCWMLLNGIAHDEAPGTAGFTNAGDEAGNSGNVAVSSNANATARSHIELWMSGPFHAIGLLRSSLTQTGFGLCASPPNPTATSWKSAATLDVVRGNNWSAPKPATPVVFPGNGSTTSLTRFIAESPDPRSFCNWGGQSVGLPLIALMPSAVTAANATLNGPNGPIPTCVLHKANTSGTASAILGGDNAVVIVPASPLVAGSYSVSVGSNGGNAAWSFNVDPNAELGVVEPTPGVSKPLVESAPFEPVTPFRFADSRLGQTVTRLQAGQEVRVRVAGTQGIPLTASALSATFTITEPTGDGFLTAYNCLGGKPAVATLNYGRGETVSNQSIVPLDRGDLCFYSMQDAEIVIDVNGYVAPNSTLVFNPVPPTRILDTRYTGRIPAYTQTVVAVSGGSSPAPARARAVAINLVGVDPALDGWIRAFPCDGPEPYVSSISARSGQAIASSVIVPVAADGTICLTSMMETDVVIDITGWFGTTSGLRFVPLDPIRLLDTRSFLTEINPTTRGQMLPAGQVLEVQVAGVRGVPADSSAATINLVALGATTPGWLRVVPCGSPSDASTINFSTPAPIANGSNVKLSPSGSVCVVGMATTHVVIDITGIWK